MLDWLFMQWNWVYLPIIFLSYIVFGFSGFGTTLIAAPWLSMYMPLNQIIPMIVILDAIASIKNWYQLQSSVEYHQVRKLFPFMSLGAGLGIYLLATRPPMLLLLFMAIFCIGYSLYQLFKKPISHPSSRRYLHIPMGLFGGLFGALFGSGGFLYALYLQQKLPNKLQIQSTQSVLISLSTSLRLILCLLMGLYSLPLLGLVILLIPSMLCGVYIGKKITAKMSLNRFNQFIYILVLCSGISLLIRYLTAG